MKHLVKIVLSGAASLLILTGCGDDQGVPPQPDFITTSLGDNLIVSMGVSFDLVVPVEGQVDYYIWTLPAILEVVSGGSEPKITVYAKEEGTISAGEISVKAYNSAGSSYVRTFYKAISVTAPVREAYVKTSLSGSLTVEKNQQFFFYVADDETISSYAWSVPSGSGLEIVDGQGSTRIQVKVTGESVNIPADAVSLKTTNKNGFEETHHYERMLCVLPLKYGGATYKTMRYGGKTWMVENLRYAGEDGLIGLIYNNDQTLEVRHGRLYTWHETMTGKAGATVDDNPYAYDSSGTDDVGSSYILNNTISSHNVQFRGICPEGWHVPNAYDRYDLPLGIAQDFGLLKNSLKEVGDAMAGIYMPPNRETTDGPTTAFNLTTHGAVGGYLRGSGPKIDGTDGLWNITGIPDNGTTFYYGGNANFPAAYYPLYYPDDIAEIQFDLIPSGQYINAAFSEFGRYSYHWVAAINSDKRNLRMTVGYNSNNFSRGWENSMNAYSVRCVANY